MSSEFDQKPFDTAIFADNPEPRCACLMLLDVSGSMSGMPISELNAGLKTFEEELKADSLSAKRVEVALVTFGPVEVAADFTTGECQGSCRMKVHAATPARRCGTVAEVARRLGFSGFKYTSSTGDQLRVDCAQRAGFFARASS